MSKLVNSLRLIYLLRNNGIMKVRELAKELNVDERMIRKYRQDINNSQVAKISNKSGPYGGIYLDDVLLTDNEYVALIEASKMLQKHNFSMMDDFKTALKKISYKFYEDF